MARDGHGSTVRSLAVGRFWFGLVVGAVGLLASACSLPPSEDAVEQPCEVGVGETLEFSSVSGVAGRYAQFSTQGGTVWITAQLPAPGGLLPDTDRTNVDIGWANDLPTENPETGGTEANPLVQVSVQEELWSLIELEAGSYWLWSSAGGDLTIQSCTQGGIFDPIPATDSSDS